MPPAFWETFREPTKGNNSEMGGRRRSDSYGPDFPDAFRRILLYVCASRGPLRLTHDRLVGYFLFHGADQVAARNVSHGAVLTVDDDEKKNIVKHYASESFVAGLMFSYFYDRWCVQQIYDKMSTTMAILIRTQIRGTVRSSGVPARAGSALISEQNRRHLTGQGQASVPWFYNGLLWPTVGGQVAASLPIGATDYASLQAFLATPDPYWAMVPPSAYVGALCSYTDIPMRWQDSGVAIVYSRRSMALYAKAILLNVFTVTGVGISSVPPLTSPVLQPYLAQVPVISPQGPTQVSVAYVLMAPTPWDGSANFWNGEGYVFIEGYY